MRILELNTFAKQAVMTPIIFVSFLISLALVDYQNSARRSHYHAISRDASSLPKWFHCLLYRKLTGRKGPCEAELGDPQHKYYHSNQRKLLEMEADEAFEMRGSVVLLLGVLAFCSVWGVFRATSWAVKSVRRLV